ncbi:pyrroline-5-carboxylate reductase [Agaribacterium haliotis]|uniref:pyrroline-5-carboxylate reductase n=1 Tax=Agaribacterium haliotis TaxID=2013869 RepID=UPI001EFE50FA|nr:pyrroline-5-carboxylate reductase [Agaribacterium haliotis]
MSLNPALKLSFLGAGNMAQAIINGLLKQGLTHSQLCATTASAESARRVSEKLGIDCGTDNKNAVKHADIVVLAVKPQRLQTLCEEIKSELEPGTLVLSVAAGIRSDSLQYWLGDFAIARSMPNTPSAIGLGASGLYCNKLCSTAQRDQASAVLEAVGLCQHVDSEELIDAVTAVSGSGPAYFFLFIEAMKEAGCKLGLDQQTAASLAIQTARGAAELAYSSDIDVAELRRQVTSPNGTTERAINCFEQEGLRKTVEKAMQACAERAVELSDQLGKKP